MTVPETSPGSLRPGSPPLPNGVALVAFDGSPTSVAALDWAADRCARLAAGTSTLALVLVERRDAPAHLRARLDVRRADLLTAAEAERARLPGSPVLTRVVEGAVDDVLVGIASAVELVVVGSGLQPHLIRRTLAERLWSDGVRRVVVVPPLVPDRDITTSVHWGEPVESLRERSARSSLVVLEADPAAPHRGERIRRGLLLSVLAPTALVAPTL